MFASFVEYAKPEVAVAALCLVVVLFLWGSSEPSAPKITVPLEPAEASDDGLKGPSCPKMELRDRKRPGFVQCYDPATLQRLGEVEAMTPERVDALVALAARAQVHWAQTTFRERRRVLNTIQNYILTHQADIVRVAARDSGKPKVDALLGEVLVTCEKLRAICAYGEGWLKQERRPTGLMMVHKAAYVEYRPLGVIGVIAPWNYPFHNMYNHIVSGIFAGNAVVSKASEYTCWSSRYFTAIVREALLQCGHSPELCQTITGFGEAGAALVKCPQVDKIIFTGSPEVGRLVMAGAAPYAKPVILELGGKDPMVLCDDVNVAEMMPIIMRGVYQNCGQNCIGVERLYVYDKIYDQFLDTAVAEVRKLRQGPPLGEGFVDCGAMVTPVQIDIIQALVDDAVAKGARLLAGGKRNPRFPNGIFYEPTILADVTHAMRIANEEVFGPVMTVIRVPKNSDDLAVDLINSSEYGLGSSVLSGDKARALALGNRICCGMTVVNDFGVNYLVQALPFGGVKRSGFDRFGGPEGLRACCLQKSVVIDRIPGVKTTIPKILQYPIGGEAAVRFTEALMNLMYGPTLKDRISAVFVMIRG